MDVAEGIEVVRELAFLGGDREERLDVYRPDRERFAGARPVVLLLHGGAFHRGSKASERSVSIARALAVAGFVVASADYRLSAGDTGLARWSAWPQNLADARAALDFLAARAQDFGGDPARIAVLGTSAGGTLALLLGCGATGDPTRRRPKAIVNLYGRCDWRVHTEAAKQHADPAVSRAASPVAHLEALDRERVEARPLPPILTIHGFDDDVVPVEQAASLDHQLKRLGAAHAVWLVRGLGHSFDLAPSGHDLRPLVVRFLEEHLSPERSA